MTLPAIAYRTSYLARQDRKWLSTSFRDYTCTCMCNMYIYNVVLHSETTHVHVCVICTYSTSFRDYTCTCMCNMYIYYVVLHSETTHVHVCVICTYSTSFRDYTCTCICNMYIYSVVLHSETTHVHVYVIWIYSYLIKRLHVCVWYVHNLVSYAFTDSLIVL